MEKIQPGKYVELGYDLYEVTPEGEEILVHQTDKDDPEKVVFGVTRGMIVPLEKAIDSLGVGDKFDVKVSAAEGFGPRDPEQIVTLERDIFLVDGKFDSNAIRPGQYVPMMTADGYRINGLVTNVTDKDVTMDFNHPLAGKDIRFKGEILAVRDATPEELHPQCGCSGGCGCDDSCDCSSDNSCGCSGGCHN